MPSDIVNLRRARKARARLSKEQEAAANRRLHGRNKAERLIAESEKVRAERLLDGARLTTADADAGKVPDLEGEMNGGADTGRATVARFAPSARRRNRGGET
ncbi:MAG: DUF4169 family protein [Hyphomicrobiaceae bacterium]|nr:DUF4169 family protein [Hyphomicrobiaceae bacterium]